MVFSRLKYCSFSFATLPINSLSRPNSVNYWIICTVFLPWNAKHISPTPHFKSFYSVSVRFLQSQSLHSILEYCPHHWLHQFDFCCSFFIFRSFQIYWPVQQPFVYCLANATRLLISLVQSPSADLYDPRNLKSCTCSNDSPSSSTCTEILSCLLTTIILDFCALIYMREYLGLI